MYFSNCARCKSSLIIFQTSDCRGGVKLESLKNSLNEKQVAPSDGKIRPAVTALLNDCFPIDLSRTAVFEFFVAETRAGFITL
jgi:hypothetical protein